MIRVCCADTPVLVTQHPDMAAWAALPAQNSQAKPPPAGAPKSHKRGATAAAESERTKAHQPATNVDQTARWLVPHFDHLIDVLEVRCT